MNFSSLTGAVKVKKKSSNRCDVMLGEYPRLIAVYYASLGARCSIRPSQPIQHRGLGIHTVPVAQELENGRSGYDFSTLVLIQSKLLSSRSFCNLDFDIQVCPKWYCRLVEVYILLKLTETGTVDIKIVRSGYALSLIMEVYWMS